MVWVVFVYPGTAKRSRSSSEQTRITNTSNLRLPYTKYGFATPETLNPTNPKSFAWSKPSTPDPNLHKPKA